VVRLFSGNGRWANNSAPLNGARSRFYLPDAQGNSRGLLDGSQGNTDGYNWDAFGNSVSRFGTNPAGYAWNVSSGYQSDGDSGLKLLGHRYYDSRTGRFISQDPAGDGDNWYGYCDNDPIGKTDPSGLWCPTPTVEDSSGSWAASASAAGDARQQCDGIHGSGLRDRRPAVKRRRQDL